MLHKEQEWQSFYADFLKISGLDLHKYKADQLRRRVAGMVDAKGIKTLKEFYDWMHGKPDNIQWFLDKLAINVSELFRNIEKWHEMEKIVLPNLLSKSSSLNCWSAGCSYGAEAHTLATILEAKFKGRHKILGTDIDKAALDQAKRGEFCEADIRHVPKDYLAKYYKQNGELWQADPVIRSYCTFQTGNLLEQPPRGEFDLIMCRNVVIYFTEEAKNVLYAKFFKALKPGGILFVGSTERIFSSKDLGFETPVPFFYRKPIEGGQQWRNAS